MYVCIVYFMIYKLNPGHLQLNINTNGILEIHSKILVLLLLKTTQSFVFGVLLSLELITLSSTVKILRNLLHSWQKYVVVTFYFVTLNTISLCKVSLTYTIKKPIMI